MSIFGLLASARKRSQAFNYEYWLVSTGPVLYSSLGFIARIECVRLLT